MMGLLKYMNMGIGINFKPLPKGSVPVTCAICGKNTGKTFVKVDGKYVHKDCKSKQEAK